MSNMAARDLPEVIHRFVASREEQGGLAAALLYGSFARGTAHERSDVDIIFIVDEGFASEAVTFEGKLFECLETTADAIMSHWEQKLDEDRHWYLWKDVKVLYERDGAGAHVVSAARSLVGERIPWTDEQIEMRRFVMTERIDRLRFLADTEPTTAAIVLGDVFRDLLEYWFKMRGEFVPSPKEFTSVFDVQSPPIAELVRSFYIAERNLPGRLDVAIRLVDEVFPKE